MTTTTPATTTDLAREFCWVLNKWLTADEMAQVVARNAAEANPIVCHSHDFCDANQAMIDAMQVLGIDFVFADDDNSNLAAIEAQIAFTTNAWDAAKAAGFDGAKVG